MDNAGLSETFMKSRLSDKVGKRISFFFGFGDGKQAQDGPVLSSSHECQSTPLAF